MFIGRAPITFLLVFCLTAIFSCSDGNDPNNGEVNNGSNDAGPNNGGPNNGGPNNGGSNNGGDAGNNGVDMPPTPSEFGLDDRPANPTCVAPDRPPSTTAIEVVRAFPNLSFSQPVWAEQAPGDGSQWFVIEQSGRIKKFADDDQTTDSADFIDIRGRVSDGGERGLLGMAFHPDWPATPVVYLSYTGQGPDGLTSFVSEFRSTDGGDTLDPSTEKKLIDVAQPFGNHNGGQIGFGPDGNLYFGLGDGGSGGDPLGHGQDTDTLLGAMLRLDVLGGDPYGIPADNPFADGNGGEPEIFAWGLRNPWRWSFDASTGELWAGDVGQNSWEEISVIERGGNYGWNAVEGTHCFDVDPCDVGPWIDPIVEYENGSLGESVTGGYVYRGSAIPSLVGTYVFADFVTGRMWGVFYDEATGDPEMDLLYETGFNISSFAQANDGELLVLNYGGTLWRIQPVDAGPTNEFPQLLSETGCVDPADPTKPAAGLIPYDINAPFWSDGAEKSRWIGLPDGQEIAINDDGDWDLPVGSVVVKSFRVDGKIVETRLFVRHEDGRWAGYSYEWEDDQSDARLLSGGKVKDVGSQQWIYPSRSDCLNCHTQAAGGTLGLETGQLNRDMTYASTNRVAQQLKTLDHIGVFAESPGEPDQAKRYPDPFGQASLDERARAYMHTNCAQCHRSDASLRVTFDMRYDTPLDMRDLCDADPVNSDLGVDGAKRLVAGDHQASLMWLRMNRRDANAMPPVGSGIVDTDGVDLIGEWIDSLQTCP